jgi:hypothetical protein
MHAQGWQLHFNDGAGLWWQRWDRVGSHFARFAFPRSELDAQVVGGLLASASNQAHKSGSTCISHACMMLLKANKVIAVRDHYVSMLSEIDKINESSFSTQGKQSQQEQGTSQDNNRQAYMF